MNSWKNSISVDKINAVVNSLEKKPIKTMEYFSNAWNLVQQDLGLHIGYAFILFVIMNFTSFFTIALYPGWFIVAHLKRTNQVIAFGSFFKCIDHLGNLLVQTIILGFMIGIPSFFLFIAMLITIDVTDSPFVLFPTIFFMFLLFFVSFMFIFAPVFVVFAGMGPWDSMKASFRIVKNNLLGFTGFFAMMSIMYILGMMTCGLLFLVILPVIQVAIYFAYEDLFQPDISDEMDDLLRHLV